MSASSTVDAGSLDDGGGTRRHSALYTDDLIATSTDAHVRYRRLDERLNAIEVAACLLRQVSECARIGRRLLPPFIPFIPRNGAVENAQVAGKLFVSLAVSLVSSA
jgi:hypothetical protein